MARESKESVLSVLLDDDDCDDDDHHHSVTHSFDARGILVG